MKKRILMVTILTASFLLPTIAFSKGDRTMPHEGWWRRPAIAEVIKLTDEEKNQLETKYVESQRKRLDFKSTKEKEQFELDVLLNKNTSDKEVMAQYNKIAEAQAKMGEEMFRFILETRKIIGQERFVQIKNLAKEWRSRNRSGQSGDQKWGRDPRLSRPMQGNESMGQEAPSAE
ncbi:MAG: hypothetical protein JEZ02_19870 [Desulfatibacillum sp.]|nr:hypothetical protein [Desulfatibacillum sp.]